MEKGEPSIVQRTLVRPPSGRIGPLKDEERAAIMQASPLSARYRVTIDRESAYELLEGRVAEAGAGGGWMGRIGEVLGGDGKRQGAAEAFTKSLTRTVASSIGRAIVNGIFGRR